MNAVSVVSCSSYDEQEVFKAIKKAIEDIGFELPTGKRVLVKPNIMSQNRPDQHTITHYTVVDAICRLLYERNNTILIGESISFFQKGLTKIAFETSGISEVAEKYGATLIEFEKEELVKVTSGIRSLNEIIMPKLLMEVDMVINACKLKTHMAMRLSGAVKNMFGCLPGGYKQKIHIWTKDEFELSDVFVDIHNIIKPSLSVMDAVIGLDGGPTALGRKVKIGKILASENAAALDIVAARMIGYQEGEVPLLTQAVRRGMIDNFDDVMIEGDIQKVEFKRLVTADIHRKNDPDSVLSKTPMLIWI